MRVDIKKRRKKLKRGKKKYGCKTPKKEEMHIFWGALSHEGKSISEKKGEEKDELTPWPGIKKGSFLKFLWGRKKTGIRSLVSLREEKKKFTREETTLMRKKARFDLARSEKRF